MKLGAFLKNLQNFKNFAKKKFLTIFGLFFIYGVEFTYTVLEYRN